MKKKINFPAFFIFLLIELYSCDVHRANNSIAMQKNFDTEGHRGCRGLMPENTIPAMLYAIDLGVTTLEMDAHITKDSMVVISHDPWFNPDITTKPDGSYLDSAEPKYILYNMTYDSIKHFDVGMKPYSKFPQQKKIAVHKPLLSELIDSVEAYSKAKGRMVDYNIEIKSAPQGDNIYHPKPDVFTDMVMQVINKKNIAQRVIIQSFDIRSLQYLHKKYPTTKTSLLVEGDDKRSLQQQLDELHFVPSVYSPYYKLVTKELIDACHQQHCKILPWTVNNSDDIKTLTSLGVDGIISDYPNLYKDL